MRGRLGLVPAPSAVTDPAAAEVPETVRQAALAAFDLRVPGAVTMDLVHDSCVDDPDAAADGERRLRFDAGPSGVQEQVDVVLDRSGRGRPMSVRVTPARSVNLELRWADGSATFATSADGSAVTDLTPQGLICLVLRSADPAPRLLQTAWVRA